VNILFVSAEASPFAKVGGLGDVIAAGSLPTALRDMGVDARVIMPLYGIIDYAKYDIKPHFSFHLPRAVGDAHIVVHHTVWENVPFYFIESWPFFGEETSIYNDWHTDMPRYIFFCQAAMAVAWELREQDGWFPNVMHVNDWHTGLIPFFLRSSSHKPVWADVRSMMTLHNVAYQGEHASIFAIELGIAPRDHPALDRMDLGDNLLATGIAYADFVTTVSPRHADEIQYSYMGYGLEGLIRTRTHENKLYGVLNGIDVEQFNPKTDPHLLNNYDVDTFVEARRKNKQQIQEFAGLEVREDVPLIAIVSRLVWQKGIDLAIPALRSILEERDVQLIALGTGEPELSQELRRLGEDFQDQARVFIMYDATLAQRIYSSADLFVMPSHYEPCGIGQMLAMRYGALPVVRETGGLADTVENYDNADAEEGTGFLFLWEEASALVNTLHWAINTYTQRPEAWKRMQRRAMQLDFSWERSAATYKRLYERVLST